MMHKSYENHVKKHHDAFSPQNPLNILLAFEPWEHHLLRFSLRPKPLITHNSTFSDYDADL